VSHAKVDHYGGMRSLVKEFAPEEFWSSSAKGKTARFAELEETLEEARVKRVALHAGEACRMIDAVELCALYPPPAQSEDGSLVLRLQFGNVRLLFAGDIDKRDEQRLRAMKSSAPRQCHGKQRCFNRSRAAKDCGFSQQWTGACRRRQRRNRPALPRGRRGNPAHR
jgi:hypothetical protein